jgi:hypothetical protein
MGVANRLQDRLCDTGDILHRLVVPDANHLKSLPVQPCVASDIIVALSIVLPTVELNDDPCFQANEVDDVATDRELASKAQAVQLSKSQRTP